MMAGQKNTYLDHNATTPLRPESRAVMLEMLGVAGNASSVHKQGRESRRAIEAAREQVARLVNAGPKAVTVFTSGATEANNLVIRGSGSERVIVSAIEHVSVLSSVPSPGAGRERVRERADPAIHYAVSALSPALSHHAAGEGAVIPVLPSGVIDTRALDEILTGTDRQTLVSVMYVNNETGVLQPIDEVMRLAKKHGALVHVDAVQAAGRIPVDLQKLGVDYLTLSSHKIGGPQGAGALVMANCVSVTPQLTGGNQEKNMRAGTENLAAIAGFGAAAAAQDFATFAALATLRDKIENEIKKIAPNIKIFGEGAPRVANTTLFAVPGLPSETQLIALDLAGISVSNGAACSSGTVKPSHVLKAMGATDAEMASSLRVSLGWNTMAHDVDCFIAAWTEIYHRTLSRHSREGGNP